MSERARRALKRIFGRFDEEKWTYGLLGKHNSDSTVTFLVPGRANFLYVTIRNATGAQTVTVARNDAGVPHSANLPVRMRKDRDSNYLIESVSRRDDLATVEPSPPSGVVPHHHDNRYYREDEHIAVSAGAGDAGKPVVTNADGLLNDLVALTTDDVPEGIVADRNYISDAEQLKLAGIETAADVTDAANIASSIHGATLDAAPLDTDEVPGLDSSGSFALLRWTWTTIKAFLATYFSTLYVVLAGSVAQTVTGVKTFSDVVKIGVGMQPVTDSTTAIQIFKADGTTPVVTLDTTNAITTITGRQIVKAVAGANSQETLVVNTNNNGKAGVVQMAMRMTTDQPAYGIYWWSNPYAADLVKNSGDLRFATQTNSAITFSANDYSIERARISGTGDFGVGTTAPGAKIHAVLSDAGTNVITNVQILGHTSSGTPAAGFGAGLAVQLKSSTTAGQDAGRLTWAWDVATHASRASKGQLTAYYTATERPAITWGANSTVALLSFYDVVTPIARQVLATGVSATPDDIITALQNLGLVKQS